MQVKKLQNRHARKRRIRSRIRGTPQRPRLSVYRSLRQITVQLIDDGSGRTLAAASTKECAERPSVPGARKLGELIAEKAKKNQVTAAVFDRNAYKYHGRVKALAEGARAGGLAF